MATVQVECLRCGELRRVEGEPRECPRCGYLGWAPSSSLSEPLRRALRERPVELRRIRAVG